MRIDVYVNSFIMFGLAIGMWVLSGIIIGNLEPVILQMQTTYPFWFAWYGYYQTVYTYMPLLFLMAIFLYIYTNSSKSETVMKI